jgi:2-haloacid dehalogenase
MFEYLCSRCDILPEETVFIDDNPKNVEGARAVGLHAILFTDADSLLSELAALGVTI